MMLHDVDHEEEFAAPIDMLESYFAAHGWEHERQEEEIVATVKGSWTTYELRAIWREGDGVLQFLALLDIKIANERLSQMYETLALVNEQLWLGHFEIWSSDQTLLFRHAALVNIGEQTGFSLTATESLVESAIEECERFYPVFQFVLWGGKSPRDAIAAAMIETEGEA